MALTANPVITHIKDTPVAMWLGKRLSHNSFAPDDLRALLPTSVRWSLFAAHCALLRRGVSGRVHLLPYYTSTPNAVDRQMLMSVEGSDFPFRLTWHPGQPYEYQIVSEDLTFLVTPTNWTMTVTQTVRRLHPMALGLPNPATHWETYVNTGSITAGYFYNFNSRSVTGISTNAGDWYLLMVVEGILDIEELNQPI